MTGSMRVAGGRAAVRGNPLPAEQAATPTQGEREQQHEFHAAQHNAARPGQRRVCGRRLRRPSATRSKDQRRRRNPANVGT